MLGSARATEGHYHGALFVKPDSPIRTADDLAGRTVGWVDRNSCAGYLFPRFALAEKRYHPTSLLGEEQFLRSHGATIQAVDAGHVDDERAGAQGMSGGASGGDADDRHARARAGGGLQQ